ncbi:MAG: ABC transporter permease [Phyllobacterium sp.]
MTLFILRRLVVCAAIVLVMSIVVFLAVYAMPGNVAYVILGEYATPADVAALEAQLGLSDPLWMQYGRWISAALHGDLGMSLSMDQPVAPLLFEALGRSAVLGAICLPLIAVIGIGLGVWAGAKRGSLLDQVLTMIQYTFVAIPEFVWCILAVVVFAGWLRWLPATAGSAFSDGGAFGWIRYLIMPIITLVLGYIAHISRMTRSSVIEVLGTSYILAARAKGFGSRRILIRHALPNALLPAITILALDVGSLIGGIVVVETIFAYPGIGWLLVYGVSHHDIPLIVPAILIVTAIYAVSNLAADVLYALIDPRIRHAGAAL